jgi:hypothetical protein
MTMLGAVAHLEARAPRWARQPHASRYASTAICNSSAEQSLPGIRLTQRSMIGIRAERGRE